MLFILVQIQAGPPALRWLRQLRLGKPYRSEGCRGVAEERKLADPGHRASRAQKPDQIPR